MEPQATASLLWVLFVALWCVAMLWTGKMVKRDARPGRYLYLIGFVVGFYAVAARPLGLPVPARGVILPLWRANAVGGWAIVACEAAAFAFACWARIHLGRLWSGGIVIRDSHVVVDTGPYRLVRHPIYTALIAAIWCFCLLMADAAALLGAALLTATMIFKAEDEERFLRRELGTEQYDSYAARTPMLVPFARF